MSSESTLITKNPPERFWHQLLSSVKVNGLPRGKIDGWETRLSSWWLNNLFEKYSSTWESSPGRSENKKYLKPPPTSSYTFILGQKAYFQGRYVGCEFQGRTDRTPWNNSSSQTCRRRRRNIALLGWRKRHLPGKRSVNG